MNHQTESFAEILCPYCFYSISITEKKDDNSKLIIHCENCGQKEISFEKFLSLMNKNSIKSCNSCCKNYYIKELYYSIKSKQFLCKQCISLLSKDAIISEKEYINFKMVGKYCTIHNNSNSFFCLVCQKHICSECKVKHISHTILNLFEEIKIKKNIEEMHSNIKKEEEEIKKLEKLCDIEINSIARQIGDMYKRRKEIKSFNKMLYQYFSAYSCNLNFYKIIGLIYQKENNPDIFINDNELKELDKIINSIETNNIKKLAKCNSNKIQINNKNIIINRNNQSVEESERKSATVIKQSKRKSQKSTNFQKLNISKDVSNTNKNNKNNKLNNKIESKTPIKIGSNKMNRYNYNSNTPIKTNRIKNKKNNEQINNLINQQIKNKNAQFFYSGLNVNLPNEKVDTSLTNLLKLDNSIMNMIFLEANKVLISSFSPVKNLVLAVFIKEKEKEKNEYKIYMNILSSIKIGDKPIIHMELCENRNILSCSDEKVFIFKILNNKINIQDIFPNNGEKNPLINNILKDNNFHILSCISIEEGFLMLVKNKEENGINHIISVRKDNKANSGKYIPKNIGIPINNNVISIEKISNNICIFILQKMNNKNSNINNNIIDLAFIKIVDDDYRYFTKFECKEKMNKIFIKRLFDNYIIISESINSLAIFDYINSRVISSIKCDNLISIEIKDNGNQQAYLYTIEKKVTDEKINEELKIKKYLIKILNNGKLHLNNSNKIATSIEINCINNVNLSQNNKPNKINNMIVINDNDREEKENNGTEKNLVLLADNEGNVYFKYY